MLSQVGGPSHSQLSVVRTPHLHGAPTTEETFIVNSDTNASNETCLKETQVKRKRKNFSKKKQKNGKNENKRNEKGESWVALK